MGHLGSRYIYILFLYTQAGGIHILNVHPDFWGDDPI